MARNTGRDYRGMTREQRLADRRERLLNAAFTLFAAAGFHGVTVERMCAAARVSQRAFYESFSGREELFLSVYDRCIDETSAAVFLAIEKAEDPQGKLHACIESYIDFTTKDVRRARIIHLESRRGGILPRRRAAAVFSRFLENILEFDMALEVEDLHLYTQATYGAIDEMLLDWTLSEVPHPPEKLARIGLQLANSLYRLSSLNIDIVQSAHLLPITIYLSDEEAKDQVEQAFARVLDEFGLQEEASDPPARNSWFRSAKARTRKALATTDVDELLDKLKRAAEIQALDRPQSEVNAAEAKAVSDLLVALQGTSTALIQIGTFLLIKVDDIPVVVKLTQRQLLQMEQNPTIFRDPCGALQKLQELQSSETQPEEI